MKKYCTVEKSSEWKDLWTSCSKIDPQENEITYELWASHMSAGDQVVTINRSRDLLLEKIRSLQDDLGIGEFMKALQPMEVSTQADRTMKRGASGNFSDTTDDDGDGDDGDGGVDSARTRSVLTEIFTAGAAALNQSAQDRSGKKEQ